MPEGKWVPFGRGYLEVEDLVARIRRNAPLYPHEREFLAGFLETHWPQGAKPRDFERTKARVVTEFVVTLQMNGFKTESVVREAEDIFKIKRRRVFQMVDAHREEFETRLNRELERTRVQENPSVIAPLSQCQVVFDHLDLSPSLSMTEADMDHDVK